MCLHITLNRFLKKGGSHTVPANLKTDAISDIDEGSVWLLFLLLTMKVRTGARQYIPLKSLYLFFPLTK